MIPVAGSVVDEEHARDVGEQEEQDERGDDVYGHVLLLPRFPPRDSGRTAGPG
jgi:hypothetical protein